MTLGDCVYILFGICVKSLMLIEEIHHILHSLKGIQHLFRLLRCRACSCACNDLLGGEGQHHGIKHNVRCAQNAVSFAVLVFIYVFVVGIFMNLIMQRFQIARIFG